MINEPLVSKINWANGIAFIATVLAVFGFELSTEAQVSIVTGIALVTQFFTVVFRTWFTSKP